MGTPLYRTAEHEYRVSSPSLPASPFPLVWGGAGLWCLAHAGLRCPGWPWTFYSLGDRVSLSSPHWGGLPCLQRWGKACSTLPSHSPGVGIPSLCPCQLHLPFSTALTSWPWVTAVIGALWRLMQHTAAKCKAHLSHLTNSRPQNKIVSDTHL